MDILPPRRLVAAHRHPLGHPARHLGQGDLPLGEGFEQLLDDLAGLDHFQHAHDDAAQDVAGVMGDQLEIHLRVAGVRIVLADVGRHVARPREGPHGAHLRRALGRQGAHPLDAADEARLVGADLGIVVQALPHRLQDSQNLLALCVGQVTPHPADGVDGVVDPVAADLLQDVHDQFAIAPDQHEERFEADLVGGDSEPEEVAVQPLQLAVHHAQVEPPLGNLEIHDLLDRLHEGGGVGVRAYAAHPLQEVHALVVVPLLARLFDPAVVVTQVHPGADDLLPPDVEVKLDRLLEKRVLGADRDAKNRLFHGYTPSCAVSSPGRGICTSLRNG